MDISIIWCGETIKQEHKLTANKDKGISKENWTENKMLPSIYFVTWTEVEISICFEKNSSMNTAIIGTYIWYRVREWQGVLEIVTRRSLFGIGPWHAYTTDCKNTTHHPKSCNNIAAGGRPLSSRQFLPCKNEAQHYQIFWPFSLWSWKLQILHWIYQIFRPIISIF
jgi:hypothetical protein